MLASAVVPGIGIQLNAHPRTVRWPQISQFSPPPSPRNCPESAEAYDTMIMIMADHEGFEGRGVRGKALPIYQFKLAGSYEGLKRDLK